MRSRLYSLSPALGAVEPTGRRAADVPRRVAGARRDEQFLANRGVNDPTLELHRALQDQDPLVRGVGEVLPAPARRVHPDLALARSSRLSLIQQQSPPRDSQ